jgi:hypothetical protein
MAVGCGCNSGWCINFDCSLMVFCLMLWLRPWRVVGAFAKGGANAGGRGHCADRCLPKRAKVTVIRTLTLRLGFWWSILKMSSQILGILVFHPKDVAPDTWIFGVPYLRCRSGILVSVYKNEAILKMDVYFTKFITFISFDTELPKP